MKATTSDTQRRAGFVARRRRVMWSVVAAGFAASSTVVVAVPAGAQSAVPAQSACVFDAQAGTLVVTSVQDRDGVDGSVRIGRAPGSKLFSVSGSGFRAGGDPCGGATVETVDLVEVQVQRLVGAVQGGRISDPVAVEIDLPPGPPPANPAPSVSDGPTCAPIRPANRSARVSGAGRWTR